MIPTPSMRDGGTQTIYPVLRTRRRDKHTDIEYDRETLTMYDGGKVSLDWYPKRPVPTIPLSDVSSTSSSITIGTSTPPIVVILPGTFSSSREYYIRHLAKSLHTRGPNRCHVVVLNHRGCNRTPLTTPRLHSFDYTGDLEETIAHLSTLYPCALLAAVGYSLGGNILTKYLGEQGKNCKLSAAITICCPYDVTKLYAKLDEPSLFNKYVLQPSLSSRAKAYVKDHIDVIQGGSRQYDLDGFFASKNVTEMNALLTAPLSGFESCEQYYRESSSCAYVPKISTPLLAINSKDDPLVPVDAIPINTFKNNPSTVLILVDNGGHLGFLTGVVPKIWYIDPVIQFFSAFL
ncbi:Alpha/Beta hydrolase protein [Kickxella alabastrina]|uniref:Alpha/Beta hydrolase protein n=1 Tax=Kickxella alabastrina TaxID=61397 RepID=UPI002220A9EE|nr:Alpha/Beta hydrolase protein [Kickxella alabastrina]KAI7825055.1 Alpha/Beta hydrolase protein [Kickxella alabastrina]